jgi:NADH-quinone oxidoreductase subunit E
MTTCSAPENEHVDLSIVDRVVTRYGKGAGSLIPVLQKTQEELGYLPQPALKRIAMMLRVPASTVFGVVTFYAQFRLKPVGKYIIRVCHGTACHVAGAQKITEAFERDLCVKDNETTADRLFTLESVACLGCCSLAPVAMIQKDTYGRLTGDRVGKIVDEYRKRQQPAGRVA